MKIAESSLYGHKTLWVKEKLLVTSNFSFSHSVFKTPVVSKGVIVWEWVNQIMTYTSLLHTKTSNELRLKSIHLILGNRAEQNINKRAMAPLKIIQPLP